MYRGVRGIAMEGVGSSWASRNAIWHSEPLGQALNLPSACLTLPIEGLETVCREYLNVRVDGASPWKELDPAGLAETRFGIQKPWAKQ